MDNKCISTFKSLLEQGTKNVPKIINGQMQKCKIGLWFLSTALIFVSLTSMYVPIKFHFNLFCTYQDMAQTGIHYKTKWLRRDNSVNIHGRSMVLVHGTSSNCHLSLTAIYL